MASSLLKKRRERDRRRGEEKEKRRKRRGEREEEKKKEKKKKEKKEKKKKRRGEKNTNNSIKKMSNFFLQDCPQVWQKKWRLADLLFSVQKKKIERNIKEEPSPKYFLLMFIFSNNLNGRGGDLRVLIQKDQVSFLADQVEED